MIRLFKRRSPQHRRPYHRAGLCVADALVASAWGLSEDQWHALTDHERREARRTVTAAPRFVA